MLDSMKFILSRNRLVSVPYYINKISIFVVYLSIWHRLKLTSLIVVTLVVTLLVLY